MYNLIDFILKINHFYKVLINKKVFFYHSGELYTSGGYTIIFTFKKRALRLCHEFSGKSIDLSVQSLIFFEKTLMS